MTKYLDPKLQIGTATITGVRRTNLIANPSFEVDASAWSTTSPGTVARSLAYAASGSFCLAYTATSAGAGSMQTTVAVSASTPYCVSGYCFSVNSRVVNITVQWLDSGSSLITSLSAGGVAASSAGVRATLTATGSGTTSPSNAAFATVIFNFAGLNAGEVVAVDAVLMEAVKPVGTYFDGSTAGARWLGTTGKSQSETVVLDASSMAITNLSTPLAGTEAANKSYVDTAAALKVAKAGDSMTGPLSVAISQAGYGLTLTNSAVGHGLAVGVGAATNNAWTASVTGDVFARIAVSADGKQSWGSGALTQDTNLYRGGADLLRTDDVLQAAGLSTTLVAKTSSYAMTSLDAIVVSNGTALTMTLPSAVTALSGRQYTVKNINSSAATVASASGTIDGAVSVSLAQWNAGTYVSDGTNWFTVVAPSTTTVDPTTAISDAAIASIMGMYR